MRLAALITALAISVLSTAPAAAADDTICADRPGKATPTCIVPAGMIQIEAGLVDWSNDETDFGGTGVKYGVGDRLHLELDLPSYASVRGGPSGFGDSAVAIKYRLTADASPVQLAVRPFVKLPTARRVLGNGKVEGGAALLADSTFAGSSVGWDVAPEVDLVADANGSGYHFATVGAASIGLPVTQRLTVSAELWGAWDFDPSGTVRQYSADAAAALLLSANAQVDAGINVGLRGSPDAEVYTGVAIRF